MLPESIEAKTLHGEYITSELVRAFRSVYPVLPVTLIQKSVEEVRLSVQA